VKSREYVSHRNSVMFIVFVQIISQSEFSLTSDTSGHQMIQIPIPRTHTNTNTSELNFLSHPTPLPVEFPTFAVTPAPADAFTILRRRTGLSRLRSFGLGEVDYLNRCRNHNAYQFVYFDRSYHWMVQFGRAPDSGLPNVPKIQGIFGNPFSQPGPNCTIQS
jgi:hypothetical protein